MARSLVDLHVLIDKSRRHWHRDLLLSLESQPCNVFFVDAIPGRVGRGRVFGYSKGTAPYVSFADDDDIVEPGSVEACVEALQKNPDAVGAYTDEVWIDEHGNWIRNGPSVGVDWSLGWHLSTSFGVHHLTVIRRDMLMPLLPIVDGLARSADWTLTRLLATQGEWIHVPMIGYRWRRHTENVSLSHAPREAINIVSRAVNNHIRSSGGHTIQQIARESSARITNHKLLGDVAKRDPGSDERTKEMQITTLIFRQLNAKTEAQAIQLAKQLCKPCNMRSYAGVRWTDEAGIEHRWRWSEIPGPTLSAPELDPSTLTQ